MRTKKLHIPEKLLTAALIELKCLGCMPCLNKFIYREREQVFDEMEKRGWIDHKLNILPAAKEVILQNINLLAEKSMQK